jgi:hypothetical protein
MEQVLERVSQKQKAYNMNLARNKGLKADLANAKGQRQASELMDPVKSR